MHVCGVYVCVETGHLEVARCEWAEPSGDWQGSAPLMRARGGGVQSPCGAVPGGCEEPESAATVFWGNLELWCSLTALRTTEILGVRPLSFSVPYDLVGPTQDMEKARETEAWAARSRCLGGRKDLPW